MEAPTTRCFHGTTSEVLPFHGSSNSEVGASLLNLRRDGWLHGSSILGSYRISTLNYCNSDLAEPLSGVTKELGQNLMDAGTVYFAEGSSIDVGKGWHFMSDQAWHGVHNYCVAPIVKGGAPMTGTYDFWAIGKDCCASSSSDFRCGEFDNGMARSGLRLLDDISRPFYGPAEFRPLLRRFPVWGAYYVRRLSRSGRFGVADQSPRLSAWGF